MNYYRKLIFCCFFLTFKLSAQTADAVLTKTLNDAATVMTNTFLKRDFKNFGQLMHPQLVALMGGDTVLSRALDAQIKDMEKSGYIIETITTSAPILPFVRCKKSVQTILPQQMLLKTPKGQMQINANYWVISEDDGKTWHFADTSNFEPYVFRQFFLDICSDLKIPEKTEPILLGK
ncbi:MAG: hypothetical protein RIS64_2860 [Bacteroidota bacterium]|jgi:hypothetical protein